MQNKTRHPVAVLMGGTSAEREISLLSGQAVLDALLSQGVNAIAIDPATADLDTLCAKEIEQVFIALHGRGGEDGCIQGFLESLQLPYTGSGVTGSALAMDKHLSKQIWHSAGLPTPASALLNADSDWSAIVQRLGLPLMIKPASEGSSVGMSKVDSAEALAAAWREAAQYDTQVLAEQWIDGQEYTIAILHEQTLPAIRLETPHSFYDYAAKYEQNDTHYHCPCGLGTEQEQTLGKLALQAFHALHCAGWGRVDLMLDQQQNPWLLEVNTVPGMTNHSLVPMAAKAKGIDFNHLVLAILETASL
ncbi:D-alanine--D-alanine ligase [Candidatus Venteria ishoeyi]|uniref:D-alanine--D-alanine ligase n=1 Tax=Candidatus Venteria ishoeyi TaxID=1899563 RepID=UPI0025A5C83C|nr:D-alanine--D-alanine ligase [Candidatus Venteria ishoeyi]MDM8547441.1 D-alanine--D-alanine ligase [Candidatus Venteria ishoeyi]